MGIARKKPSSGSALVGDGRRAPGCCFKGCANVPRRGAICCDIHGRALQEKPEPTEPKDAA